MLRLQKVNVNAREKLLDNFDQGSCRKGQGRDQGMLDRFMNNCGKSLGTCSTAMLALMPMSTVSISPAIPSQMTPSIPAPTDSAARRTTPNTFRVGHPLAQRILERAKDLTTLASN